MPVLSGSFWRGRRQWLLLLVACTMLGRAGLLLAGGGLAFPDEQRYLKSIAAVELLLQGHLERACVQLADTQGRPADALLRLPAAAGQVLLQRVFQLSPTSPASLLIPQAMNWLIIGLNVGLLWYLARRWLPGPNAALVALVYSALGTTQLYVRHLLPYDLALTPVLLALVYLTAPGIVPRRPGRAGFVAGVLSLLAFGVYPGYYFAPLLPAAALLAGAGPGNRLRAMGGAGLGAALVVGLLEALTRLGHISYLQSLQALSDTITQGDVAEGFSFLPAYVWHVEGGLGGLLLLAVLPGAWVLARAPAPIVRRAVVLAPVAAWLLHASLVFFAHQFVFYGRVAHFFGPFLALYLGAALRLAEGGRWPLLASLVTGILATGSWLRFSWAYAQLVYPLDVLADFSVTTATPVRYLNAAGVAHELDYVSFAAPSGPTAAAPDSLLLLNFTFPYPLPRGACAPQPQPAGYHCIFQGPHFLTFPAYGYEGFTAAERPQLPGCAGVCRIYRRNRQ